MSRLRPAVAVVALGVIGCGRADPTDLARAEPSREWSRLTLPEHGLAVGYLEDGEYTGIELFDMAGKSLAKLPGYHINTTSSNLNAPGPLTLQRGARNLLIASRTRIRAMKWPETMLANGYRIRDRANTRSLLLGPGRPPTEHDGSRHVSYDRDVISREGVAFDLLAQRQVDLPPGCRVADRHGGTWYLICGVPPAEERSALPSTIATWIPGTEPTQIVAPPQSAYATSELGPIGPIGHWRHAAVSPDGSRLLLQWSAECEVPEAFWTPIRGGTPQAIGAADRWGALPESVHVGWDQAGRALVHLPKGECGSSADTPGVYSLSTDGELRLVLATAGKVRLW